MSALTESLRPLVESKSWDYCIVWKFGDDPSRYIQWFGCCCNGSSSNQGVCDSVKKEIDETKCRDTFVEHGLCTKACDKLANVPFYLPLYSGVHGEVAMSGRPSWSHDTIGTQVLFPVNGGLIELYISKQVPRDEEMIETLTTQFNALSKDEWFCDTKTEHMVHLKTEGSPNGEGLWSENSSLVSAGSAQVSPTQSIDMAINVLGNAKRKHKNGNEQYQSKNLLTERRRRNRIKEALLTLRSVVPKISKMDKASIYGDAIEYIKELENNIHELQDELKRLAEDEIKSKEEEVEVCRPKGKRAYYQHSSTEGHSLVSTSLDRKTEAKVEVHRIGAKDFWLKLVCGQERGGFKRIMETLDSFELQVIDVNVTTCYGHVLTNLKVEAKGKQVVAAKSLKESLLTCWMSSMHDENQKERLIRKL